MDKNLAPIVLFVYNRLLHTQKTIDFLSKNILADVSELFIYSDGFKNQNDAKLVNEVRNYIITIAGFKKVTIIESDKNKGLANSIIVGVTEIVNRFGKIIVIEDDLVTSPYFLQYMNDALDLYETEEKVISIHGYIYPVKGKLPETFFIKGADCWGWATWKRGWDLFEANGEKLLSKIEEKKAQGEFDFNNSTGYFSMLQGQTQGKNDSWAIRWYASAFLNEKLTLYPGRSLVRNIGLDDSGTHCGKTSSYDKELTNEKLKLIKIHIKENKKAKKKIERYFKNLYPKKNNRKDQIKNIIKMLFPPILFYLFGKIRSSSEITKQKIVEDKNKYGWFGDYSSWEEAMKECSGYDSDIIIEKCRTSLLKVKNGEAAYERDSVLFDKIEYSFPLLSALLWVASNNNKLNVLDFGGSLGSSYFQNKEFLSHLKEFSWNIVEQEHFVAIGKNDFEDKKLKFYCNLKDCIKEKNINFILLSSVIQYLKNPFDLIKSLLIYDIEFIFIDRTSFINGEKDIITKQIVPSSIYNATYPCWFFNENKFIKYFTEKYYLLYDFQALDKSNYENSYYKGFFFKLK